VILLDLGQGDLVAIVIDAATTGGFAGFVAQATPIVDSFQFR
jgi:hypothetical protein